MTAASVPDVFVNLRDATVRSARNYHRLEHLGRRNAFTFHEETITDLVLAEMAGKAYTIDAACPNCTPGSTCGDWNGNALAGAAKLHVRPSPSGRKAAALGERACTPTSSWPLNITIRTPVVRHSSTGC